MLDAALNNATSTLSACAAFDSALMSSLLAAGGNNYSELAALSFRFCSFAFRCVRV